MTNIARAFIPALVVLVLAGAGCGSRSSPGTQAASQPSPPPPAAVNTVVMRSLAFNPSVIHANAGERVVWHNRDSAPHNVIYVSGPRFKSSRPVLKPGQSFSIRVSQPGTIHYYCSIHPFMKATIVVSP